MLRGLRQQLGAVVLGPWTLDRLEAFPMAEYTTNRAKYQDLYQWYNGDALNETMVQGGKTVEKYPIHLNPIKSACLKHVYALWGDFRLDSQRLVQPYFKGQGITKGDNKLLQEILNFVWWENSGHSVMNRTALYSQIFGGGVIKLSYVPQESFRQIPIRIESVHPSNCVLIPKPGDEYRIDEAWIVRSVTPQEAWKYGIVLDRMDTGYYVEHWTDDKLQITINGLDIRTGFYDLSGNPIYYTGANPFGFVPVVYIPHLRSGNGFYGDPLVDDTLKGIVKEYNARKSDIGDAISDQTHRYLKMVNVSGMPQVVTLAPNLRAINLGSNPNITGRENPPDLDDLGEHNATIDTMIKFADSLFLDFRREAFVPAIADGEDEGSQRSAQTLAARMWPLQNHIKNERMLWGDAMALMDSYLLRMLSTQRVFQWEERYLRARIDERWSSFLPKDRTDFVNELVTRASAHIGSLEHLMELVEDIEDPPDELDQIVSELKELSQAQQQLPPSGDRFNQPSGSGEPFNAKEKVDANVNIQNSKGK